MKVNAAVQTISASVADAIEMCDWELRLPQFQGSKATVDFLCVFDELFDCLDRRNPLDKYMKAPLSEQNFEDWRTFFEVASSCIRGLTDQDGKSLLTSRRSTLFIGFLLDMNTIITLYQTEVEIGYLHYLLTYKWSQDHIEPYFFMVRSGSGSNDNPSYEVDRALTTTPQHVNSRQDIDDCWYTRRSKLVQMGTAFHKTQLASCTVRHVRESCVPWTSQKCPA